jgi:tRNA threonylcarbamoyl adenosine modification protein YeaZ
MTNYGLALHTSSAVLGLAIDNFAGDRRDQTWDLGYDLASLLHSRLQAFLHPQTWSDLAYLAVACGPGSFTGTRIGVVTARTLAQQLDLPVFAISTLKAMAWTHLKPQSQASEAPKVAVTLPAHRGFVFGAVYEWVSQKGVMPLVVDSVFSPDEWQDCLHNCLPLLEQVEVPQTDGQEVTAVLELAHFAWTQGDRPHWSTALPFYGQHPVVMPEQRHSR